MKRIIAALSIAVMAIGLAAFIDVSAANAAPAWRVVSTATNEQGDVFTLKVPLNATAKSIPGSCPFGHGCLWTGTFGTGSMLDIVFSTNGFSCHNIPGSYIALGIESEYNTYGGSASGLDLYTQSFCLGTVGYFPKNSVYNALPSPFPNNVLSFNIT